MRGDGNWKMQAMLAGLAATSMLGGCAELTTVYHNRPIPTVPRVVTIDAYQRNMVFANREDGLRVCAEAAPDTFAAISASLAASGDVVKKQASLAAAISQSGATIERTQTINLLRESMYRTCERYLNGAISKETLVIQAARDQRTMLAVLAIEQLTRTVRPESTILSAGTTSASVPDDALITMIEAFRKERDTAEAAWEEAKRKFDTADGTAHCSTITAEPTDDTKPAWDTCDSAKATMNARADDLKGAKSNLEKALALTGGTNGAISAGTGQGPSDAGGGGSVPSDVSIKEVADAVRQIATAPGLDEALMFCIGHLSVDQSKLPANDDIRAPCIEIIRNRGTADEQILTGNVSFVQGDLRVGVAQSNIHVGADAAGPTLMAYLDKPTAAKERARRSALVRKAAAALKLPADPFALVTFLSTGKPADRTALLAGVKVLETNAAGKADLAAAQ